MWRLLQIRTIITIATITANTMMTTMGATITTGLTGGESEDDFESESGKGGCEVLVLPGMAVGLDVGCELVLEGLNAGSTEISISYI